MEEDSYWTISAPTTSHFKEKKSKFIGYSSAVDSEEDVKKFLEKIQEEHPKATHHCFAYILDEQRERAWDDGEPSGSAGLPILGQIKSAQVTHTIIVVVRYYGGTPLGVGGLKSAYKTAAKLCMDEAKVIKKEVKVKATIESSFEDMHAVMTVLKNNNVQILEQTIDNTSRWLVQYDKKNTSKIETGLPKNSKFTLC